MLYLKKGNIMNKNKVDWALAYAKFGWSIIPIQTGGKKFPYTSKGLLDGTSNKETIKSWWKKYPDANIGVVVYMSKLIVLDADNAEAVEVVDTLLKTHNITTLKSKRILSETSS